MLNIGFSEPRPAFASYGGLQYLRKNWYGVEKREIRSPVGDREGAKKWCDLPYGDDLLLHRASCTAARFNLRVRPKPRDQPSPFFPIENSTSETCRPASVFGG